MSGFRHDVIIPDAIGINATWPIAPSSCAAEAAQVAARETLVAVAQGFGTTATYQFHRTERWLGRLDAIYSGAYKPVGNFDELLDYVLAFFLNCHHIKDWLKNGREWNDSVHSYVKEMAVEQFVSESDALRICADLCNGNKHYHFDRALRSGEAPQFRGEHTRVDTTTDPPIRTTRYMLRTVRGDTDAYDLARECLECWRAFIHASTPDSLQIIASRNPNYRSTCDPKRTNR